MMKPASELIFKKHYKNFPEFAEYRTPLDLMCAFFILDLQAIREEAGVSLIPSPDPEGWARLRGDKDSRHYAVDRLSDGGDVFPERGRVIEFFMKALMSPRLGGLGIYADTRGPDGKPWPMVHMDKRPHCPYLKAVWCRYSDPMKGIKKKYISLGQPGFNPVIAEITRLDRRSMR